MIYLPEKIVKEILREGEKNFPKECCGVLFGNFGERGEKIIISCEKILNQFEQSEQYHRFKIDAEIFMQMELAARRKHLEILGFYHSHPNAPAIPSEYDRKNALPIYSYIIVSVIDGAAKNIFSWVLNEENFFVEEKIEVKNFGNDFNSDDAQEFHEK